MARRHHAGDDAAGHGPDREEARRAAEHRLSEELHQAGQVRGVRVSEGLHPCLGRARSLVPGAKEGRRHQTDLAARRAGSVLQRRVRRYLCPDLRADFGWLLPPRAARLCRARASRTAQRSRRCEDRPSRHPGRENLSGVLDPAARRHGARHFRADTDLAGAKRDPAERDSRLRCREDRDSRLGSVHVRREPESHQFPFQRPVLSAERHRQGATRLR